MAVTADAIAKTAVSLATIGNFADPPRGNLHEIGTGFGIARTAAGEALGVDVNNRAVEYLHQKLEGDLPLPEAALKSFEVSRSFMEKMRGMSVEQSPRAKDYFPDHPQVVDRSKARDQFGLRKQHIEELQREIVPGSGKIDGVGKPADVPPPSGLGSGAATLPLTLKREKPASEQADDSRSRR